MKFKKLTLTLCLTVLCMNHVNAESHYDSLINYCYNGSYTNGNLHAAEQCFYTIARNNPNEGEAYFWLGMINFEKGRNGLAKMHFNTNLNVRNTYRQNETHYYLKRL